MDGNFFKGSVTPQLSEFMFDLQRFETTYTAGTAEELTDAISKATDGDIIQLTAAISISETLTIDKTLTIDFKSYKLTYTGEDYAIKVANDGNLTLKAKYTIDGISITNGNGNGVQIENGDQLTTNNILISTNKAGGICINNAGTTTATTDKFTASGSNGTAVQNSGTLTISGAATQATNNGTGVKQTGGSFTLTSGTIQGGIGAKIDAGNFTMNGGTLQNYDASSTAALQLNGESVTAEITAGTIGKSPAIDNTVLITNKEETEHPTTLEISGGTFNSKGIALNNQDADAKVTITRTNFNQNGTYTGNNITATNYVGVVGKFM